jgi:tetratricopeptide (TPR) repeat protein
LYLELGRATEAVAHFAAVTKLKPDSAAAHFNLGTALTVAGTLDDAIGEYQVALQIRPDYASAHNNLGGILLERGSAADALPHFRQALQIDPANVEAHYNMARAFRQRGELSEAIEYFRQTIELKPDSAPALSDLAWLLATAPEFLRDPNQAIRLAERAADITGWQVAGPLDVLAAAYAAAGLFDRAIDVSEAALRLTPQTAAAALRERQELYKQHRPYRLSVGDRQ